MSQRTQSTATSVPLGSRVNVSRQLVANVFQITNARNLSCNYKLWEVIGLSPDDENYEQNKVALRLRVSSDVKGPAELLSRDNKVQIAIPEGYHDPKDTYSLTPQVVRLAPLSELGSVDFTKHDTLTQILAKRFLEASIVNKLRGERDLWQPRPGRGHFYKSPSNIHDPKRQVDVFSGFKMRVVYVEGVGYCVLVDCATRYVSSTSWPEVIPFENRWNYLRHKPGPSSEQKLTHCTYRFGNQWYEISVQFFEKENLAEKLFPHPDTNQPISVYEYTLEKWNDELPEWCADIGKPWTVATYIRWKGSPKRHAIAHFCYPVLRTADLDRMGLGKLQSRYAIKKPDPRINAISDFIALRMSGAKLGTVELAIDHNPLELEERKPFLIPALEFGKGTQLAVSASMPLADYPSNRLKLLQSPEAGFWKSDPMEEQWVLLPASIKSTVWLPFKKALEEELKRFLGADIEYRPRIIPFDEVETGLLQQTKAITEAIKQYTSASGGIRPSGYCLAILPANAERDLSAYLTHDLSTPIPQLHTTCIHLSSFERFFALDTRNNSWKLNDKHPEIGKARGYIRNVAIKVLLLNRKWPFILPNTDNRFGNVLYIGVDVLNGIAGFTFVGGGGKICIFVPKELETKEKIPLRKMKEVIQKTIQDICDAYEWTPNHIILVRDGRLFDSELKGFLQGISGIVLQGFDALEISKTSAVAVRLFSKTLRGNEILFENPRLGNWFRMNQDEASVVTTGWPFTIQGTSMPLSLRRVRGNTEIELLTQRLFELAQLAWTAPDRPSRYPLVISHTDMRLEAIASSYDEESEYEPDEDEELEEEIPEDELE